MKRLKGPELKAPDLKVPPVVRDLFQDLRDRRLLPLLALLLLAIVAVPFLLSDESEDEAGTPLATPQTETAQAARLTVIEATPGLRDYRERLRARVATNPFKQRYTAPVLSGAKLQSETVTTTAPEPTSTSTSTSTTPESSTGGAVVESPSSGGGGGKGSSGSAKVPPITLFTFVVDVQYSRTEERADGSVEMAEPTLREGVEPYTPLPGEKAPVVTYLGVGAEAETALLMVSKEVTAVYGDGKCKSGISSCELLEVETGIPQTFEYGPNGVRFKINVLKIEPLATGQLKPR